MLQVPEGSPEVLALFQGLHPHVVARMVYTPVAAQQETLAYLNELGITAAGRVKATRGSILCMPAASLEGNVTHHSKRLNLSKQMLRAIPSSLPMTLKPACIDKNLAALGQLGLLGEKGVMPDKVQKLA